MRIGLFTKNEKEPYCILSSLAQLNLPQELNKRREYRWKAVDLDTGEVLGETKPPTIPRQTPITPYAGSWAHTMEKRRAGV